MYKIGDEMAREPVSNLKDYAFYKSFNGLWFAFREFGYNQYFSPDGLVFYELYETGFGNGFSFVDPHHNTRSGIVSFQKDHVVLSKSWLRDQPIFRLIGRPDVIELVYLPTVREVDVLYKLKMGIEWWFCVTSDKYRHSHDKLRIFLGTGEETMRSVSIVEYVTYGGVPVATVSFDNLIGVLDCRKPSWEGLTLKEQELGNFKIVEDGGVLTRSPKS